MRDVLPGGPTVDALLLFDGRTGGDDPDELALLGLLRNERMAFSEWALCSMWCTCVLALAGSAR